MNRALRAVARTRRVLSHATAVPATRRALHSAAAAAAQVSAPASAAAASGAAAGASAGVAPRSVVRAFAGVPRYATPRAMYEHLLQLTAPPEGAGAGAGSSVLVRNFVGTIESMGVSDLTIATDLFPAEALAFYTRHNLLQTDPTASAEDRVLYQRYYNAARGGGQGDYRYLIREKLANVVDALHRFPHSKRAVLTVPFPTKAHAFTAPDGRTAPLPLHSHTDEQKCLRELHFYLQPPDTPLTATATATATAAPAAAATGTDDLVLCCTGVMRAQAVSIFPKNIHFIGSVMHLVADRLHRRVGTYTQLTTALVAER